MIIKCNKFLCSLFLILSFNSLSSTTFSFKSGTKVITCGNLSSDNSLQKLDLDFGTITVPQNASVGTVLSRVNIGTFNLIYGCDNSYYNKGDGFSLNLGYNNIDESQYGGGVYNTSIPGLGIRISNTQIGAMPYSSAQRSAKAQLNMPLVAELVKISDDITSGTLSSVNLLELTFSNTIYKANIGEVNLVNTSIIYPSCNLDTKTIQVDLGSKNKLDFDKVGSYSESNKFNIVLNCNQGTNIQFKITPGAAGGFDNENGVLNQDESSTSKGYGVQILKDSNPLIFGQEMSAGKSDESGRVEIPLNARLYKLSEFVSPGIVKASATFTITYN